MRISDWSSDVCSSDLLLAGLSGVSWALFCVFRLWQGHAARSVLADGCLLSATLSLALHFWLETTVTPDVIPLAAAVDRQSVVQGKSVSVRVDLGGRRHIKKK